MSSEGIKKMMEGVKQSLPDEVKPHIDGLIAHIGQVMTCDKLDYQKSKPDYSFAPPFNSAIVDWELENWTPNDGDVLVATYPKTGTTWLREVTRCIRNYGDEKLMKASKLMELPFFGYLEAGTKVKFDVVNALPMKKRIWGTHLTGDNVNVEEYFKSGLKVIYVMRNPKDMAVSLKKFFQNMGWLNGPNLSPYFPQPWDEFVKRLADGNMPMQMKYGEWYPQHIRSWMKYKNNKNFHYLFYEDMKKDPELEIARLAEFMEVTLTKEDISKIKEMTSFDTMKKANFQVSDVQMFRKGGVGNWKEHFTVAQSEYFDQKMKEGLGDLDMKFTYTL